MAEATGDFRPQQAPDVGVDKPNPIPLLKEALGKIQYTPIPSRPPFEPERALEEWERQVRETGAGEEATLMLHGVVDGKDFGFSRQDIIPFLAALDVIPAGFARMPTGRLQGITNPRLVELFTRDGRVDRRTVARPREKFAGALVVWTRATNIPGVSVALGIDETNLAGGWAGYPKVDQLALTLSPEAIASVRRSNPQA